jgi:hypothetical protein
MNRFKSLGFLRISIMRITGMAASSPSVVSASQQPARLSCWAACLGLAFLLALSGCAPVKVRLGMRVYLDKTPVTSMEAKLPKGPGIAPGEKSPLVVAFTGPDGKVLVTEGQGHGKVLWKDLRVTASVATTNQKGVVSLPQDPRISDGLLPHVMITVPSHPDIHAELDIPLRYDRNFSANFSGDSGYSGTDGSNGSDGRNGSPGSMDPDHPSAGGDGTDGTNGSDGQNGGPGGDGPPVQVRMALRSGSHPLLQMSASAAGTQYLFLVDPEGGSLTVTSEGGSGGSGGRGGRGGRGGSGGIGIPSGRSGNDGSNGQDGLSGLSGRDGIVTVTYDPQTKPFLGAIRLSNQSGARPIFKEEPVPALW